MKITPKLNLTFVLVSALPLLLIFFLVSLFERNHHRKDIFNHLESVVSLQVERIENLINHNFEKMMMISTNGHLRENYKNYISHPDKKYQKEMNQILSDFLPEIQRFRHISVVTMDGKIIASSDPAKIGALKTGENYFKQGQAKKFVDFYLDEKKSLLLHLSGPIYIDRRIRGVLVIESCSQEFKTLVSNYNGLGKTGEIILAKKNEKGEVVVLTPTRFDSVAALTKVTQSLDPDALFLSSLTKKASFETESIDYRGKAIYAHVHYISPIGWDIIAKIDKDEVLEEVYSLQKYLLIAVISLSLIIVIATYKLSRSFTQPILHLMKSARKIMDGEFSTKLDVAVNNEIGTLAETFIQMTDRLLSANTDLEKKVEARTKELQCVNELLLLEIDEREQMQKEIRKSEKKYRTLFDNLLHGCAEHRMIRDEQGKPVDFIFLKVNAAFETITGLKRETITGKGIAEIYPGIEKDSFDRLGIYDEVLKSGISRQFEAYTEYLDKWFSISAYKTGEDHFVILFDDITARKQAESEVRIQKEFLQNIIDNIPIMITYYDRQTRVTHINKEFSQCLGYSSDDVQNMDMMRECYPDPEYCEIAKKYMQEAVMGWRDFNVRGKNGAIIESSWSNVRLSDGNLIGIGIDLTERKMNENKTRESEQKYRTLFEEMVSGFALNEIICDEQGKPVDYRMLEMNKAYENIVGAKRENRLGRTFRELAPHETNEWIDIFGKVALTGEPQHYVQYSNSYDKYFEGIAYSPQKGQFAVTFNDVTERVKKEKELQESEERFSKAFNVNPCIMSIMRMSDRKYIYVNDAFVDYTGYTREEIIGKGTSELNLWIKQQDREEILQLFSRGINPFQNKELEYNTKSGEQRTVLVSAEMVTIKNELCLISSSIDITERKQHEEFLRFQSEIIANISEGIYLVKINDGTICYTNPKFEKIFGYSPDEMIGKHVSIVNAPDDKTPEETAREIIDFIRKNGSWKGAIKNIKKDGTHFWCFASVSVFNHHEYGEVLVSVHSDISKQKEIEIEKQNYTNFLRMLLETIPNPIFYKDRSGIYTGCNTAFAKVLGRTKEDIIGKTVYEVYPKELADIYFENDKKVFNLPEAEMYETLFPYTDGANHNVIFTKAPFTDAQGSVAGLVGVMVDITERKRMESALQKSEKMFRELIERAPIGICYINADGNIILVNAKLCEIMGYTEKELIGMSMYPFISEFDKEIVTTKWQERMQGIIGNYEREYTGKNGKKIWLSITSSPVFDNQNIFSG